MKHIVWDQAGREYGFDFESITFSQYRQRPFVFFACQMDEDFELDVIDDVGNVVAHVSGKAGDYVTNGVEFGVGYGYVPKEAFERSFEKLPEDRRKLSKVELWRDGPTGGAGHGGA